MRVMRKLAICGALAALMAAGAARAQYDYNPSNPDEQGNFARYFGAVKDDKGAFLEGVTLIIQHSYVLVTDDAGRFTGYIPADIPPDKALIGCAKPGYRFVKMTRRPGVTKTSKWVEIACVLQRAD